MSQTLLRVLVVDNEYLIALDVERILRDAFNCEVVITTRAKSISILQKERFNVVLLDTAGALETLQAEVDAVMACGANLAFSTTCDEFAQGMPGFPGMVVLLKPYRDEILISVIGSFIKPAAS